MIAEEIMKRSLIAAAAVLAASVPAAAQESLLGEEFCRLTLLSPDPTPDSAGAEGIEPEQQAPLGNMDFLLGARVGYMRGRDAEKGNWLGGVQGRLYLVEYVAVEGSIEFHQDEYMDGDVVITFYPVQVSAILSPLPQSSVRPYAVGGAGWYYTRIDYRDALDAWDSETEHFFGIHLGGGVELSAGDKLVVTADFRYVFVDEPGVDNSDLEEEEWDYWELTAGLCIRF